jgi:flagellar biosynthesis protein FlhG
MPRMTETEPGKVSQDQAAPGGWHCPAPRVVAVTSGKGGVGKSNIVVNLGLALARQGLKVLLIDADLGLANLDILLGLTPRFTIHEVLSHRQPLAEAIVPGPEGVKILPASSGISDLAELDEFQKLSFR